MNPYQLLLTEKVLLYVICLLIGKCEQPLAGPMRGALILGRAYLYGSDGLSPRDFVDPNGVFSAEYLRRVELSKERQGDIAFYGWDVDGVNKINSGPLGPRNPVFLSGYVQSKMEYRDLIMNFGVRYEKFDPKVLQPDNVEDPTFDKTNDWIDEDSVTESPSYDFILPRVNFAFPVSDRTVFYAQFGKYVQMPNLNGKDWSH